MYKIKFPYLLSTKDPLPVNIPIKTEYKKGI